MTWLIGPVIGTIAMFQFGSGAPVSHVAVLLAFALLMTLALSLREAHHALLVIADEVATYLDRERDAAAEAEQVRQDEHLTPYELAMLAHPVTRSKVASPEDLRRRLHPVRDSE